MKANAPEKLYISNIEKRFSEKCHSASIVKYCDDDIEYTRTDAFIEKAIQFLKDHLAGYDICEDDIERSVESFKLAMKDE